LNVPATDNAPVGRKTHGHNHDETQVGAQRRFSQRVAVFGPMLRRKLTMCQAS
jgi:hypothetical protein